MDSDDRFEAEEEAEREEQSHWEQEMVDMAQERYFEDLDQRRWAWTEVAVAFNGPVKVQFT
jgi:hypothetical protein